QYKSAELTISAELRNASKASVKGMLQAEWEGIALEQPVELAAVETKTVKFSPEQFPKLKLAHPRIWWPYQMGMPNLSFGNCSGENLTVFVSTAANSTGCSRAIPSHSACSIPLTDAFEALRSSALMVNSADLYCPSSFEETNGFLTATAPLEVRNTSFQIPMFLSGGVGFQSTHVMPRSYLSGAKISRA